VLMGSIPFTVRKSTALLDAAKKGKQVRVKIDGACSTGTGIGAIGYAQVVPEGETAFEKFKFAATRHCVQMRKEAGPDGIIDKATIEKTRDEWLGSNSTKPEMKEEVLSVEETKEAVANITEKMKASVTKQNKPSQTVEALEPDFDDIPF